MAGVTPKFQYGPLTYEVAAAVTGGQVVEGTNAGKIQPAGATSLRVLGVASKDAVVAGTSPGDGTVATPMNLAAYSSKVAVWRGAVVPVTFASAANTGDKLVSAAGGQVTAAGATPDARSIIGYATEQVASGAVGHAFIY